MGNTPTTSPAKPVHRLKVGNISVTVWAGPRATFQREYVFQGNVGYADSIRVEDASNLKKAIDQFVLWSEGFTKEDKPEAAK